jgi:hypothetical protein
MSARRQVGAFGRVSRNSTPTTKPPNQIKNTEKRGEEAQGLSQADRVPGHEKTRGGGSRKVGGPPVAPAVRQFNYSPVESRRASLCLTADARPNHVYP